MSVLASFMNYIDPVTKRRTLLVGDDIMGRVPQHVIDDRSCWIDAGSFRPHLLMSILGQPSNSGVCVKFSFTPFDTEFPRVVDGETVTESLAERFARKGVSGSCQWPSQSSNSLITCYVYRDGVLQDWGSMFEVLGLAFKPGNKGFKRMAEVIRSSRCWNDRCGVRANGQGNISYVTNDMLEEWGLTESAFDGIVFMSQSYAIECLQNVHDQVERETLIKRVRNGNIRRLTTLRATVGENWTPYGFGAGTIKGDGVIVPDDQLVNYWFSATDAQRAKMPTVRSARRVNTLFNSAPDIVTWTGNIKNELGFDDPGKFFLTWDPKKPSGPVTHDFQTKAWMKNWLDNADECCAVIDAKLTAVSDSIAAGEIPDWMIFDEDYYTSSRERIDPWGMPRADHASELLNKSYLRYQAAGLDMRSSATYTSLQIQGVAQHVESKLNADMSTGNIRPGSDAKIWAPAPWSFYGYAITDAFLEYGGGYDFSVDGQPNTKVFWHHASQSIVFPHALWETHLIDLGGADLDDRICVMLRWDPDLGEYVLVIYRQPNSKGEFMVVRNFDLLSFDWYNTEIDPPHLNNKYRPTPITESGTKPKVLPNPEWVFGETYTKADAFEVIDVALNLNQGVGQFMNTLMVADSMDVHLNTHANPEQVVDTCQASPYREFFKWHNDNIATMWEQLIIAGEEGKTVDFILWTIKVPKTAKKVIHSHEGFFTKVYKHGAKAITAFRKETKSLGFKLRSEHQIEEIMALEFDPEIMDMAERIVGRYMIKERAMRRENRILRENKVVGHSPYARESAKAAKIIVESEFYGNGDKERAHQIILAIYQVVNTQPTNRHGQPDATKPYGIGDNVIFSSAPKGTGGMLDLFLEACVSLGIANWVTTLPARYDTDGKTLLLPSTVARVKTGEFEDDGITVASVLQEMLAQIAANAEDSPESIQAAQIFHQMHGDD